MKLPVKVNLLFAVLLLPACAMAASPLPSIFISQVAWLWVAVVTGVPLLASSILLFFCSRQQYKRNRDLKHMLNCISSAIIRTSPDGRIEFINTAAEKITGWDTADALGKPLLEVLNNLSYPIDNAIVLNPGEIVDFRKTFCNALPLSMVSRTGISHKVTINVYSVPKKGSKDGTLVVIRDVTEDVFYHELLRETQKRFQSMFDNAPLLIAITTLKGKIIFANKMFAEKTGYSQYKLSRTPLQEIIHPSDFPRCRYEYDTIMSHHSTLSPHRIKMLTRDERVLFTEMTCLPLTRPDGKIKHILCMARDISDEINQEQVIRQEREQRRLITENTEELILQLDRNFHVTSINRDVHSGFAAADGVITCAEVICNDRSLCEECPIRASLQKGKPFKKEIMPDKRVLIVSASPLFTPEHQVDGAIVIVFDITEQRMLELQLLHTQKMDAMGKLAGGIAHDFNNLLQVILGYSDMLQKEIGSESGLGMWRQVVAAGNSAKNLVRQLLTFSRKDIVLDMRSNDLNDIIRHLQKMLGRIIGEHINLELKLASEPLTIHSDIGMLEQVMMNLCINAKDAMSDGGKLTISTYLSPSEPKMVCCQVTDTGHGMSRDVVSHIFEPFFSTKPVEYGTGLGLAIVYSIVRKHNGEIEVESEVDIGTTFLIRLPLHHDESVNETTDVPRDANDIDLEEHGNDLILHIEDDANVRKITRTILESDGYSVLEARTGNEGISLFDTNEADIQAVLLDAVLPGLSGKEVALHIHRHKPDLPVLFCSGYMAETVGLERHVPLIQKPFSKSDLLGRIRHEIRGRRQRQGCKYGI